MKHPQNPLKWIIWTLAATFYLYEFFMRVFPSVMVSELMSTFKVDAPSIGALSGFYFYIYAPLQLPVGILTDRYGARRLLALASLVVGIGSLLFSIADAYWVAATGRFLMGAGSSFGFVGMVYICSHWFAPKRRGIMIGMANTIGMIGAILGEGPLRLMVNFLGWRISIMGLAIFGILLAVLIYILVRNEPKDIQKADDQFHDKAATSFKRNLGLVCTNRYTWLNSIMALFFYVTTPAFAGLWGISFIHHTYNISIEIASFAISMVFVGWAVGGPIIGSYADRLRKKKPILLIASLLGAILMSIIVYVPDLSIHMLFFTLFLLGCISSAELLNFGYSIDINPQFAKGTATAFTNFIVILGTAVMQPFIGFLLDRNWTGQMEGGIRIYSAENYTAAMTCFPIAFLIAFVLGLFLKSQPKPYESSRS